jgi:hypothetical protein
MDRDERPLVTRSGRRYTEPRYRRPCPACDGSGYAHHGRALPLQPPEPQEVSAFLRDGTQPPTCPDLDGGEEE